MTAFASQMSVGGRFLIEREIGRGAVGIVYRAMDEVTNQPVALKVIAISGVDAGEEARFRREGRVLAGLVHPGIVRLVAFGQLDDHVSGGMPYVAMEWLEGEDIAQRQRRSPLPLLQCLDVAAQVCDALAAAHAAGIVHRDVKPSNVLLVGSGPQENGAIVAKLVDFGVASAEDAKLTRTGAIIGTPAYMAPEQARGDEGVNARADLYALGATLFEMITGRPPHVGPTPIAILARLVTTPPPRLSDIFTEVAPELDDLMAELLATDSSERPRDAGVAADRLRACASNLSAHEDTTREARSPQSTPPISQVGPASQLSHSSGGSRLVTTILATHVPKGPPRARLIAHLRARGAEATELGGDALVAHLGVSRALGDEATRAIDLALRLAKVNATVGIATGRSRVERGVRPIGEVVDRAAALARDASRGQVVLDTTTAELARGRYEFQIREDGSALVGTAHVGKKDALGGAPFVGREAELSQLVASFERALDDRTPVLVTLTGAPGIGKTRLRREAIQRVSSHSTGARVVLARCETFGKSHPLGVAADLARQLASVPKGVDLEDARLGAVNAAHAADADLAGDALELLARLLANEPLVAAPMAEMTDARAARDALWLALTQITVGLARKSAIVVGIEDAQWCDHESLSWLDHVLARAASTPFWVMLTTRPSFWREDPERFAGRDHVRIELRPLSKRSVRTIARAILGERVAQGDVIADSIATQAAGSPLFAEELARLAAQGRDAAQAPTIEAAMQVQLDSLDDATRDAASRLSVFGQVGWDQGLEALGVPNAIETLRILSSSEVVVEQAQSRFKGTREYSFKHALLREVAYAALGEDALRDLHARAGRWLAKMAEDDATVARHLELGHAFEEAAIHLEKAARRALAAHALQDAVTMAEKSLAFAEDKPTQFARAQLLDEAWSRQDARAAERDSAVRSMEEAIYDEASEVRAKGARVRYEDSCGGSDETSARIDQVRKDAQAAGLVDEEARSAAALASRYAFAGELDAAAEVAEQLLSLAQRHALPGAVVDAWQTLAVVRQARGDVGAALEARRSAARAASEAGLKMREATLTINVGFALTTVGAKAEARVAIEGGIALAQAIGSPGTVRHGQMNLLGWTATFGPNPQLDRMLAEPRGLADSAAAGSWVPHDRATLGVLYYRGLELLRSTDDGDCHDRARSLLRTAAQGYRATKMLDVVPVAMGFLAEAERRCGAPDKAREIAREAAQLLDSGSASLLNEAPVFLALHDACVDLGDLSEAREAILRGIPRLATRVQGLSGTPYPHDFLTQLQSNAGLLAAAEAYGLMPKELAAVLGERTSLPPM